MLHTREIIHDISSLPLQIGKFDNIVQYTDLNLITTFTRVQIARTNTADTARMYTMRTGRSVRVNLFETKHWLLHANIVSAFISSVAKKKKKKTLIKIIDSKTANDTYVLQRGSETAF